MNQADIKGANVPFNDSSNDYGNIREPFINKAMTAGAWVSFIESSSS
jgi:hypothetical protein